MIKARSPSDPPPSVFDNPDNAFCTTPTAPPRDQRYAEPFASISASALLHLEVSHSGWVRKEGYGYRSWKSRFMVLYQGCLYYFKETSSSAPKGKIALNGYRCISAPDRERADRYPYVFQLVPDNLEGRTYYISSPSKIEMEGWIKEINRNIQVYCPSDYDYAEVCDIKGKSPTCPTVSPAVPVLPARNGNRSNDRTIPHSFPKSQTYVEHPRPLIPPRPFSPTEEALLNEDQYEDVDNLRNGESLYLKVLPNEDDGSKSSPLNKTLSRPLPPIVPPKIPPSRPLDLPDDSDSEDSDDDEPYIDLTKQQNGLTLHRNDFSANREKPVPFERTNPPVPKSEPSSLSEVDGRPLYDEEPVQYISVLDDSLNDLRLEDERNARQIRKVPPKPCPPKRPQRPPRSSDGIAEKEEHDYLPKDCFRPDMMKNQAKIFLELGRMPGEYIINASLTSDTRLALSVWLASGVKHYLIFKRQDKFTLDPSLTDEYFSEIRQLVKFYYTHPLPKSKQRLTSPFATNERC